MHVRLLGGWGVTTGATSELDPGCFPAPPDALPPLLPPLWYLCCHLCHLVSAVAPAGLYQLGDGTFPGIGLPAVAGSGLVAANTLAGVGQHLRLLDELGV